MKPRLRSGKSWPVARDAQPSNAEIDGTRLESNTSGHDVPTSFVLKLPSSILANLWPTERVVLGIRVCHDIRKSLLGHGAQVDLVALRRTGFQAVVASFKLFSNSRIALKWTFNQTKQFKVLIRALECTQANGQDELRLVVLNLDLVGVGGERTSRLAAVLQRCRHLEHFNVSHGWLLTQGAKSIAPALANCTALTHLDLSANDLGSDGVEALAPALGVMTRLETLMLESNGIGDRGLALLAAPIGSCPAIACLSLSQNGLNPSPHSATSSAGAPEHLAPLLERCGSLARLELSHDRLEGAAMRSLAGSLRHCPKLTELVLAGDGIGAEEAAALSAGLGAVRGLQRLDLFANSLACAGAAHLAAALRSLPRLQSLELCNNAVGDAGVRALAEAVGASPGLRYLGLGSNLWGDAGAESLLSALEQGLGPALATLDCRGNAVGEGVIERMCAWRCVVWK